MYIRFRAATWKTRKVSRSILEEDRIFEKHLHNEILSSEFYRLLFTFILWTNCQVQSSCWWACIDRMRSDEALIITWKFYHSLSAYIFIVIDDAQEYIGNNQFESLNRHSNHIRLEFIQLTFTNASLLCEALDHLSDGLPIVRSHRTTSMGSLPEYRNVFYLADILSIDSTKFVDRLILFDQSRETQKYVRNGNHRTVSDRIENKIIHQLQWLWLVIVWMMQKNFSLVVFF
jgi:hypothetical protein